MVKNAICILLALSFFTISAFAQDREAKEIPNLISAVKSASPGDYIVLPSGRRYVLTNEEIQIVNGSFNFEDLSSLPAVSRDDGTEIITISEAHKAFVYPDGQSIHILRTSISFSAYLEHYIEAKYHIGHFVDIYGEAQISSIIEPGAKVFRAYVEFQPISDGVNMVLMVSVTAYHYKGESFRRRYYPTNGWSWGNVTGNYTPVGEPRRVEFDF